MIYISRETIILRSRLEENERERAFLQLSLETMEAADRLMESFDEIWDRIEAEPQRYGHLSTELAARIEREALRYGVAL